MKPITFACLLSLALASGCDDTTPGTDGGTTPGMDSSTVLPDGRVIPTPDSGGRDTGPGGCVPSVEICGDRIDQDCDGRDTGCGDNDMDGIDACRAGDDLTMCDCNDLRADVRPPFGTIAGAPEACDGIDNDCNGRIDEAAACCPACMALGDSTRGDVCTPAGACDCTTLAGEGPCPAGQTCCTGGCVDILTDFDNCGFCGTVCTPSTDRCTAGGCACGSGPACDLDRVCTGGSC